MRVLHEKLHLVDAFLHYPGEDGIKELHIRVPKNNQYPITNIQHWVLGIGYWLLLWVLVVVNPTS